MYCITTYVCQRALIIVGPAVPCQEQTSVFVDPTVEAASWWVENNLYCCTCIPGKLFDSLGSALGYSTYIEAAAALLVLLAYVGLYASERKRLKIDVLDVGSIISEVDVEKPPESSSGAGAASTDELSGGSDSIEPLVEVSTTTNKAIAKNKVSKEQGPSQNKQGLEHAEGAQGNLGKSCDAIP
jgi:hypothetical protein